MSWKFHAPKTNIVPAKTLVIIDNGHDIQFDKYSPAWTLTFNNGAFKVPVPKCSEAMQNRTLVKEIVRLAPLFNVPIVELYPETTHVVRSPSDNTGVNERIARIKEVKNQYSGTYEYIYLVSIHTDAASMKIEWSHSETEGFFVLFKPDANGSLLRTTIETHIKSSFGDHVKDRSTADINKYGLVKQSVVDGVIVENGSHTRLQDVFKWISDEWRTATEAQARIYAKDLPNHPFYTSNKWIRQLAQNYVNAFCEIEQNYRQFIQNKALASLQTRQSTSSRQTNVTGTQNNTPTTYSTTGVRTRTTATLDDASKTTKVEDLLKKYYDFSQNDEGNRLNNEVALVLEDEIEIFMEDNWGPIYASISLEDKIAKMNLEKTSDVPYDLDYQSAKSQYPDLVSFAKENIRLGRQYIMYADKMIPKSVLTQDEEFINEEVEYVNPHLLYTVAQHKHETAKIQQSNKMYPGARVWLFPQSSAVLAFSNNALDASEDVISVSFTRSLSNSSFTLNLAPVKAVFVKNLGAHGAWRKIGASLSDKKNFKAKSIQQNLDFFYDKALNPGDIVYISIDDSFTEPEKRKTPVRVEQYIGGSGEQVDFIGVIDSVKRKSSISNTVTDSVTITGRTLMKFYDNDTVFFQTANMCYSSPLLKDLGEDQILSKPEFTAAAEQIQEDQKYNDQISQILAQRVACTNNDLAQLIDCNSVIKSLHWVLDKLKILPQEYRILTENAQNITVKISDAIMRDFDMNLIYRTYYSSRLSTMEGSVSDFIRQLVPQPFVEFYGDTLPALSKDEVDSILKGSIKIDGEEYEIKQDASNWKYPDNQELINNPNTQYSWSPTQIFHLIVKNAPLNTVQWENICANYAYEIPMDFITQISSETTDAEMYSVFQAIPRSLFIGDKQSDVMTFPPVLFATIAKRYGFRFKKFESSYFAVRTGTNKTNSMVDGNLFAYTEKDLRTIVKYSIGNAFYEKGTVTTIPLRHIHPGMAICISTPSGKYFAYIKAVKQVRDKDMKNCKTEIEFDRGLLQEGHSLIDKMVEITLKENATSFTDCDARDVKFFVDIFGQLLTKRYSLSGIESDFYDHSAAVVIPDQIQLVGYSE